jgi:hypothetical protein
MLDISDLKSLLLLAQIRRHLTLDRIMLDVRLAFQGNMERIHLKGQNRPEGELDIMHADLQYRMLKERRKKVGAKRRRMFSALDCKERGTVEECFSDVHA